MTCPLRNLIYQDYTVSCRNGNCVACCLSQRTISRRLQCPLGCILRTAPQELEGHLRLAVQVSQLRYLIMIYVVDISPDALKCMADLFMGVFVIFYLGLRVCFLHNSKGRSKRKIKTNKQQHSEIFHTSFQVPVEILISCL